MKDNRVIDNFRRQREESNKITAKVDMKEVLRKAMIKN